MRRTHLSIAIQCAINAPREYMLWHLGQQLEIQAPQRTISVAEAVEMRDFALANRIKPDAKGHYQLSNGHAIKADAP